MKLLKNLKKVCENFGFENVGFSWESRFLKNFENFKLCEPPLVDDQNRSKWILANRNFKLGEEQLTDHSGKEPEPSILNYTPSRLLNKMISKKDLNLESSFVLSIWKARVTIMGQKMTKLNTSRIWTWNWQKNAE